MSEDKELMGGLVHVVQFSGGVSSWAVARLVRDDIMGPRDSMVLLFADTLIEDEDTYAFIDAAAADLDVPITRIADGRTPWELFSDEGFLGNTRVDLCSRVLKRELLWTWMDDNCEPSQTVVYLGIDWTEAHRIERIRDRMDGKWNIQAPLIHRADLSKADLLAWAAERGLPGQRLYAMGMPHANCGGGCVKAGQGHFAKLLEVFPERFSEWESNEAALREQLGDYAILRDRRGGTTTPLPLSELRQRITKNQQQTLDLDEWGGCGCAID